MSHLQIGVQIGKSVYQLNEIDPKKNPPIKEGSKCQPSYEKKVLQLAIVINNSIYFDISDIAVASLIWKVGS